MAVILAVLLGACSDEAGKAAAEKAIVAKSAAAMRVPENAVAEARAAAERAADKRLQPNARSEAARAPTAAVEAGANAELFDQAASLERQGRGPEAVKLYGRAARAGSARAAMRLAEIYDKGLAGVPRDYAESLKWYNAARVLGEDVPMAKARNGGSAERPISAAAQSIDRFPTLEAPDTVARDREFVVQVSLTVQPITPDVRVQPGPGIAATPDGAISIPAPPAEKPLRVDVVMSARGFTFVEGSNFGQITLARQGDSTPAVFHLRPDPAFSGADERVLHATFTQQGQYLGRVSKPVRIAEDLATHAAPVVRSRGAAIAPAERKADLTLIVIDGGRERAASEVIVLSPHLQPERESAVADSDVERWSDLHYGKILEILEGPPDRIGAQAVPLLDGMGAQLFDAFAPPAFRRAFALLDRKLGARFQSIQIITNNPALPWELMRPIGSGGERRDFLGATHLIARWHLVTAGRDLPAPAQVLRLREMIAIAPRYSGVDSLGAQARELDVLRRVAGARIVDGRLKTVSALFDSSPSGIIHFVGHGEARRTENGLFNYAIKLEDAVLDVTQWRGLGSKPLGRGALVFFNACEVGRASRVARYVEGWAPAMLEAGAGAYISGLWPLNDAGAADFASRFYQGLAADTTREVVVADLLKTNRRLFRQTGDPTFLAYVMYGDVNLRIQR